MKNIYKNLYYYIKEWWLSVPFSVLQRDYDLKKDSKKERLKYFKIYIKKHLKAYEKQIKAY